MIPLLRILAAAVIATPALGYTGIDDCDGLARNGPRLVRIGDSAARARAAFGSPQRTVRLRKTASSPGGRTWVYEFDGHNPRTVQIGVAEGRVVRVCEFKG